MVFHMKFIAIYVLLMITAPIEYPYFIIHSACFGAFWFRVSNLEVAMLSTT